MEDKRFLQKAQTQQVVFVEVLAVDLERRRISLKLKTPSSQQLPSRVRGLQKEKPQKKQAAPKQPVKAHVPEVRAAERARDRRFSNTALADALAQFKTKGEPS